MNRRIRTAITFLLAAMLAVISTTVFAQVLPENVVVLSPQVITISSQPGFQYDPHVDGDLAVYSDNNSFTSKIQYYNFSTGVLSTIPQVEGAYDRLNDVDQGRIVFSRNTSAGSALMLFDTTTGSLREIARTARSILGLAFGGQTVAFIDQPAGLHTPLVVMVLDLATSALTQLTDTDDMGTNRGPEVSRDGNVVVWEHCEPMTFLNCDIHGASRSNGNWTIRALTTNSVEQFDAATNGVDVVFTRHGQSGYELVVVPVSGGSETVLEIADEQHSPSMHGSLISFVNWDGVTSDLYLYDLLSNRNFQVTQTPSPSGLPLWVSLNDVTVLPTGEVRLVWQIQDSIHDSGAILDSIRAATFVLPITNSAPTADAGPDQLVIAGHLVALAGAGADPDGDALTFAWALTGAPAGSTAGLTSPTLANATFIPDRPGVYTAQLTVSDFVGSGAPDSVRITAITATEYTQGLIQEASRRIRALPASAVTNQGNQNALTQFLSHVVVALQSGDLITARQQLEQAISRTDGCALRGIPDGNGPSRDWITTCAAQRQVYPLLVEVLAAIAP